MVPTSSAEPNTSGAATIAMHSTPMPLDGRKQPSTARAPSRSEQRNAPVVTAREPGEGRRETVPRAMLVILIGRTGPTGKSTAGREPRRPKASVPAVMRPRAPGPPPGIAILVMPTTLIPEDGRTLPCTGDSQSRRLAGLATNSVPGATPAGIAPPVTRVSPMPRAGRTGGNTVRRIAAAEEPLPARRVATERSIPGQNPGAPVLPATRPFPT